MHQLTRRQLLAAAAGARRRLRRWPAAAMTATTATVRTSPSKRVGAMDELRRRRPVQGHRSRSPSPSRCCTTRRYPYKEDWLFFQELTKRTNVTLEPDRDPGQRLQPEAQRHDRRRRRAVHHPEDVPPGRGGVHRQRRDPAGQRLPRPDAELPGQGREVEPAARHRLAAAQEDGKFYLLPGLHEDVWLDYSLAMRTDILQQLNLAGPEDLGRADHRAQGDEGRPPGPLPVLRPVEQAPTARREQPAEHHSATPTAPAAGWDYQHATWDASAGKFVFTGAMDQYKQMLEYLNTLVKEKLLDPESFTQADDQRPAEVRQRQVVRDQLQRPDAGQRATARTSPRRPGRDGREDPAADRARWARSRAAPAWRTAS